MSGDEAMDAQPLPPVISSKEQACCEGLPANSVEFDGLHAGGNCEEVPALPTDQTVRKSIPICTGVLDYFPNALAAVAACSRAGNDQHNPGEPLRWAREKSADHADCLIRHLIDRGKVDSDGVLHSAKAAWRALALLQLEIEAGR